MAKSKKHNKQKTHKPTKKVLKTRNSGSVYHKRANSTHLTAKDSSKSVRQRRNKRGVQKSYENKFKGFI